MKILHNLIKSSQRHFKWCSGYRVKSRNINDIVKNEGGKHIECMLAFSTYYCQKVKTRWTLEKNDIESITDKPLQGESGSSTNPKLYYSFGSKSLEIFWSHCAFPADRMMALLKENCQFMAHTVHPFFTQSG